MRDKGKILALCLHALGIAALCIRILTAAEIKREYAAYYNDETCPALVFETGEIQKAKEWTGEKEKQGDIKRQTDFYWYYDKKENEKIYCKPKGELNGKWRAAFCGYRRLTVKQEVWQPVEEIFKEKPQYREKRGEEKEFIRFHIWSSQPEKLKKEIEEQNWQLEELYLKNEMPYYRHGNEVKDVTQRILKRLSFMLAVSAFVGYIVYEFLRTCEKDMERKVYIKLGASAGQYKKEVLRRIGSKSIAVWALGLVLFFLLHRILMEIFCICFSIPQYHIESKIIIRAAQICGIAVVITDLLAYAAVMAASKTESEKRGKKVKGGLLFLSLLTASAVFFWSCMLEQSIREMDRELSVRKQYDAVVFFDAFVKREKAAEIGECPGIKRAEPTAFVPVEIWGEDTVKTTALGIGTDSVLWQPQDTDKKTEMPENESVFLTEATARKAGLKPGERFSFSASYGEKEFNGTAKCGKLTKQQTCFEEAFCADGFGYANAVLISCERGEIPEEIYGYEHVGAVLERSAEEETYRSDTASVRTLNRLLGGSSLLAVLFIMQSFIFYAAGILKGELELLSALGCGKKRKKEFVLGRLAVTLAPGLAAGTAAGYVSGRNLLESLSTDCFYFRYGCLWQIFLIGIMLAVAGIFGGYIQIRLKVR